MNRQYLYGIAGSILGLIVLRIVLQVGLGQNYYFVSGLILVFMGPVMGWQAYRGAVRNGETTDRAIGRGVGLTLLAWAACLFLLMTSSTRP